MVFHRYCSLCFLLKFKVPPGTPVSFLWHPGVHRGSVWVVWRDGLFCSFTYFYLLNLKTASPFLECLFHSWTLFFNVHFSDMLENLMPAVLLFLILCMNCFFMALSPWRASTSSSKFTLNHPSFSDIPCPLSLPGRADWLCLHYTLYRLLSQKRQYFILTLSLWILLSSRL